MTNTTPTETKVSNDPVNHPKHYTAHPSGVECIQITEHMGFNLGNAMKYVWRADLKNDALEDMKKAIWYIQREIAKREAEIAEAEAKRIKSEENWTAGIWKNDNANTISTTLSAEAIDKAMRRASNATLYFGRSNY